MPGVERLSISAAVEEAGVAHALGLPAVLLFGIPDHKDAAGSGAYDDDGIVQLATRAIKDAHPELLVMTDVCLCEYTDHGHCGLLGPGGTVENDSSVELIARTAVSHARAGADVVAPSDMMDGRVGAIRAALDDEGFGDVPIVAYSAKFASAFYGPFREAAGSTPAFGDRRAYQMDPANGDEAVREALLDVERGRGRRDGQAGARVSRRHPPRQGRHADARRRLQRQRRVCDGEGGRGRRGARRAHRRAGDADLHPPCRRRHHHQLPREGRSPVASDVTAVPKIRSRKGGAAVPMDDVDRRLLNLMQGKFPLQPRPYAAVATEAGIPEEEVLARVQRLLDERIIRQVTPIYDTRALGYGSMLVAAKVDPEHPWRAAKIINSHPGVSHNYLRNHDFNMWFTLAVEGDSKLGLQGTLDLMQELTGATSIRQLPTLKLFKIRMELEMDGDTKSLSTEGVAQKPVDLEGVAYDELDRDVIRATQGDLPVVSEPYVAAAAQLGMTVAELLEHMQGMKERGILRRVAAILYHRRAGFSANGMGVWKVPEDKIEEFGPRMASFRGISHCYQRPTYEDWPYSVFTMAHGRSKEECDAILDAIAHEFDITERATLYSSTEFKKIRLLYFTDDFKNWEREHGA